LVHVEEWYSGFLQQAFHQTNCNSVPKAGSDEGIEIDFVCSFLCVG